MPLSLCAAALARRASMSDASMSDAHCHCFCACNSECVDALRRAMPPLVTSRSSAWFGYLTAIYGSVTLPFDLRRLNFLYMRDARWWSRFPHVEWPISGCRLNKTGTAVPDGRPCAPAVCRRWVTDDPQLHSLPPPPSEYIVKPLTRRHTPDWRASARAVIFYAGRLGRPVRWKGGKPWMDSLSTSLGRGAFASHKWLEVAHIFQYDEAHDFCAAPAHAARQCAAPTNDPSARGRWVLALAGGGKRHLVQYGKAR